METEHRQGRGVDPEGSLDQRPLTNRFSNRLAGRCPTNWKLYIVELTAVGSNSSTTQAQLPAAIYCLWAINVHPTWSSCSPPSLTARLE